jgi:hypothetical protein
MNNKDLQLLKEAAEDVVNPKLQGLKDFSKDEKSRRDAGNMVGKYYEHISKLNSAIQAFQGFLSTPEFEKFYSDWIVSQKYLENPLYDKEGNQIDQDDLEMIITDVKDIVELFV